MAVYIVDSNFFIQAHRYTYPIDIAIGFWNKVENLAKAGIIISIDKVKAELYDKNDDLEAWCREFLPIDFFKDSTEVMEEYSLVSEWALSMNHHYLPNAVSEFLDADIADAFLVSYALSLPKDRVLVTQEVSAPNIKRKIKIPECCNALGVTYLNSIEMLRELGETF
jgi:hypothetical protein